MSDIDVATLRKLLRYEPETGKLFWLPRDVSWFKEGEGRYTAARACTIWNKNFADKEAFTATMLHGHRVGAVLGKNYLAHRIVWAIATGAWPTDKLDHIDRNPGNNRIGNLRFCTQAQNTLNRAGNQTGRKTSLYKGVYWQKEISRWRARFRSNYLGTFKVEEDAARAYDFAAREHSPDFAFTNFAAGG